MAEPVTMKLRYPVEFGKETITELTFRRGKPKDLKGVEAGEKIAADDLIRVAARLCGQNTKVIEELDEEDAGEVFSIALGFIGRCLGGGKTR